MNQLDTLLAAADASEHPAIRAAALRAELAWLCSCGYCNSSDLLVCPGCGTDYADLCIPGHFDPTSGQGGCPAFNDDDAACTRPASYHKQHVAGDGDRVLAVWDNHIHSAWQRSERQTVWQLHFWHHNITGDDLFPTYREAVQALAGFARNNWADRPTAEADPDVAPADDAELVARFYGLAVTDPHPRSADAFCSGFDIVEHDINAAAPPRVTRLHDAVLQNLDVDEHHPCAYHLDVFGLCLTITREPSGDPTLTISSYAAAAVDVDVDNRSPYQRTPIQYQLRQHHPE